MNNNKGFTLVELLVVVLIIGILAAMAMPAYFKAVERARASEAETLIGTVVNSQQRYKMKTGKYATKWTSLDVAPANAGTGLAYYCTKGAQNETCGGQNGFKISLSGDKASTGNTNGVIATRVGTGQYGYSIYKRYDSTEPPVCEAAASVSTEDDKLFCAEFMGVETYAAPDAKYKVTTQSTGSNG